MLDGYNSIAPIYDGLANLVFGRSIRSSQKLFLSSIKDCSTILILGGGTGWLLKELLRVNDSGEIHYIEASSRMIELAKAAVKNDTRVNFIHGTEDSISELTKFDAVITNFYLDAFTHTALGMTVRRIRQALLPEAYWIVTDFTSGVNGWQRLLLKVMYCFFRVVTRIEAVRLPDWQCEIGKAGFSEQRSTPFYNGFILSILYKLPR